MADGNVSDKGNKIQISLAEQDADFLQIFYNEIGGAPITHYTANKNQQKICHWQCLSHKIKQDLALYNVIPRKTGYAIIPPKLNKKFYPDFIRGYFDGDGSIWIERNGAVGFGITSHNIEILEQIIQFFAEQGVPKVKIKIDHRCNTNYSFKYRKQAILQIYKILYYSSDCLYMQRKFDKFQTILQK